MKQNTEQPQIIKVENISCPCCEWEVIGNIYENKNPVKEPEDFEFPF